MALSSWQGGGRGRVAANTYRGLGRRVGAGGHHPRWDDPPGVSRRLAPVEPARHPHGRSRPPLRGARCLHGNGHRQVDGVRRVHAPARVWRNHLAGVARPHEPGGYAVAVRRRGCGRFALGVTAVLLPGQAALSRTLTVGSVLGPVGVIGALLVTGFTLAVLFTAIYDGPSELAGLLVDA